MAHTDLGRIDEADIWVDGVYGVDDVYGGRLIGWVVERYKFCLEMVLRPKETERFVLLPRRWIVERTFGWLNHSRRLLPFLNQN